MPKIFGFWLALIKYFFWIQKYIFYSPNRLIDRSCLKAVQKVNFSQFVITSIVRLIRLFQFSWTDIEDQDRHRRRKHCLQQSRRAKERCNGPARTDQGQFPDWQKWRTAARLDQLVAALLLRPTRFSGHL